MYDEIAGPTTLPWQTKSLNSSLALENSSSFDIRVKLTNTRDSNDTRYITLKPNRSCMIGRASKTKGEAHKPSDTNALFDCPVVSRQHAEIKAHPWSPTGDQVTIIDYGSMHGTRVNGRKLDKGRNMALRNGDQIEFGDRVTRGDDTHDSVRVTYHRLSNEESHTMAEEVPTKSVGYRGDFPSDDDEEEDDFSPAEYDHDISDISDDGYELDGPSSAKTTPEQPKGSIGSQHNPIQLEPLRPAFVDLTDDEQPSSSIQPSRQPARHNEQLVQIELFEDSPMRGTIPSQPRILDSNKVVEDSIDKNNSVYEWHMAAPRTNAETVKNPFTISMPNPSHTSIHELAGATTVGAAGDHEPSSGSPSEGDMSDAPSDYEILEDEQSDNVDDGEDAPVDEDVVSEEDMLADEDAPAEDEDGDSLYDPDSYQPNREPSPELGSDTGFVDEPYTAPAIIDTVDVNTYTPVSPQLHSRNAPAYDFAPSRPPFDPIRAPDLPRPGMPQVSTYTSPYGLGGRGPYDVVPGFTGNPPSRPPPPMPVDLPGGAISMPPPPPPLQYYSTLAAPPQPPRRLSGLGVHPFPAYQPPPQPHAVGGLPPLRPVPTSTMPPHFVPQSRPESCYSNLQSPTGFTFANSSFTTRGPASKPSAAVGEDRISIDELVAEKETAVEEEAPKSPVTIVVKRKANEMTAGELTDVFDAIPYAKALKDLPRPEEGSGGISTTTSLDVSKDIDSSEEPTPRRRRITDEDDVSTAVAVEAPQIKDVKEAETATQAGSALGSFAKMAGSAVLGGVATFAFLTSPLAEKVLESLL